MILSFYIKLAKYWYIIETKYWINKRINEVDKNGLSSSRISFGLCVRDFWFEPGSQNFTCQYNIFELQCRAPKLAVFTYPCIHSCIHVAARQPVDAHPSVNSVGKAPSQTAGATARCQQRYHQVLRRLSQFKKQCAPGEKPWRGGNSKGFWNQQIPGFKNPLWFLLAVWPWWVNLISLCLRLCTWSPESSVQTTLSRIKRIKKNFVEMTLLTRGSKVLAASSGGSKSPFTR